MSRAPKSPQPVVEMRPSKYILTGSGALARNVANAITMMSELDIRYNSFTCRTYIGDESPWGSAGNWTDHDDVKCAEWCQHNGLNVDHNIVAHAAMAIARSRKPYFHPVESWLRSLKWDGEPRLDNWIVDYLGATPTDFVKAVSAKWMISAVKRVVEPGCQADYTLVLEGRQGRRKSTALRILAGGSENPEWFSDDIADMGSKDSAMQLQGKWLIELAELDAFRKAEMTTIKAWLVRREDNFRPPYGRRPEPFPRQNVFCATTNKANWGNDETGLRRFWPVAVGNIDVEGLAAAREQLWAEAFFRFQEGETSYLSESLESMAAEEQGDRQELDAWKDAVEDWIESPGPITPSLKSKPGKVYLNEILEHCLKITLPRDWTPGVKARVSRILRLAGWASTRSTRAEADENGRRPEYWSPMKS